MTEITTDNTKAPINALERIEVLEAENAKLKAGIADLDDYVSSELHADLIILEKIAALVEGKE